MHPSNSSSAGNLLSRNAMERGALARGFFHPVSRWEGCAGTQLYARRTKLEPGTHPAFSRQNWFAVPPEETLSLPTRNAMPPSLNTLYRAPGSALLSLVSSSRVAESAPHAIVRLERQEGAEGSAAEQ